MMDRTDDTLISEYRAGNDTAFSLLIDRYSKPIYSFVASLTGLPHDAEDITQETFVKVWKTLPRYRLNNTFKSWLYTIARNTAIDRLRKKKIPVFSDFDSRDGKNIIIETARDIEPLPPEVLAKAEDSQILSDVLSELSPEEREILVLHYTEDMTFDTIGDVLKKPLNTVKSKHRRALLKLRTALENKHQISTH